MTARASTYTDGIQVSGQDLRLVLVALGTPDAALSARSGVRPGAGDLQVTANGTPNMTVNVAAGQAVVDGTESFAQGCWVLTNDGTVNLTIAAADPTNPRRDLIIARAYSETVAVGSRRFALEVVTGTPAVTPVDPALPANSLMLARVAVAAGATSIVAGNITDLRAYTAALGGVIPCLAAARPSSPYAGMMVFETDTGLVQVYDGTSWRGVKPDGPRGVPTGGSSTDGGVAAAAFSAYTTVTSHVVTLVSGRRYEVNYNNFAVVQSIASDSFTFKLVAGGIDLPGAQLLYRSNAASANETGVVLSGEFAAASSGATTIACQVLRSSGTGTLSIVTSQKLLTKDIGT